MVPFACTRTVPVYVLPEVFCRVAEMPGELEVSVDRAVTHVIRLPFELTFTLKLMLPPATGSDFGLKVALTMEGY